MILILITFFVFKIVVGSARSGRVTRENAPTRVGGGFGVQRVHTWSVRFRTQNVHMIMRFFGVIVPKQGRLASNG